MTEIGSQYKVPSRDRIIMSPPPSVQVGWDFDDVLLIPQSSEVNSREDVDLSVSFDNGLTLEIPIIASPMRGIISKKLIGALDEWGGIGILHRFYDSTEDWITDIEELDDTILRYGISVGLIDQPLAEILLDCGASIICIDVANGYLDNVLRFTEKIANLNEKSGRGALIMSGSIATYEGAMRLADVGTDLIRVGVGPGQLCTTRNVTGVGVPQISAIMDCVGIDKCIVADGGIRNSGDAVKALAAGADVLMLGTLFAQTYESDNRGIIYGMASRKLQEEYYHSVRSIEGMERVLLPTMTLEEFLIDFLWGMKSAFTYMNAKNIPQLQTNAQFITAGTGSIKK